jgi:hypothetical protein
MGELRQANNYDPEKLKEKFRQILAGLPPIKNQKDLKN